MQSSLRFNLDDFERVAKGLGALERQIPFALATAMNAAVKEVRASLITNLWPQYVEVRNKNALRQALRMEFARKTNLSVAITDAGPAGQRLNLGAHAHGGQRAHRGRRIAIAPKGTVRRGAKGVAKSQRPAAIIANTPKRALRMTSRGILVGQGGRLHLKYALVPSATIKADVPFDAAFERAMGDAVRRQFPLAVERAMQTAFKGRK